jgi:hypothetical protein
VRTTGVQTISGAKTFTAATVFSTGVVISSSGTNVPLTITHDGTGNCFVVNDVTGDTSPFVIDSSGNVGIGTTTPTFVNNTYSGLHIHAATATSLKLTNTTTGQTSTDGFELLQDSAGNVYIWNRENTSISIATSGTSRITITNDGKVGIGVTPASAGSSALQVRGDLDIFGNDSDRSITYNMGVGDDGITGWYRSKIAFIPSSATNKISQHIAFFNKDGDLGGSTLTERMRIATDGNVGIGTTSPQRKLHISNNGAEGLEFFVGLFANESRINSFNRSSSAWNKFSVGCSTLEFFVGSGGTSALAISSTGTATFTGQIIGQAGAVLTGTVAGNVRALRMQTSGSTRWEVGPGFDAESGSNVGSTFWITRWSDAGAFLGTPIAIDRATGRATFENTVVVPLGSVSSCSVAPFSDLNTGLYFPAANVAAVVTDGVERLRVDASGNVGIGTNGGSNESGFMFHVSGNAFFTSGPNATTKISIDSGDQRLVLGAYYQFGVAAYSFISATNNAETGDTDLQLRTGTTTRMTIASDGKITAAGVYNNTVGGTNRDVFVDSGGLIGYVSSIRQSKINIESLDNVSWLSSLHPVSYFYRKRDNDGNYTEEPDGIKDYGLIAEEVEQIAPELCFYDMIDNEPQLRGVTYSKLITPMLKYIQVLQQEVNELKSRLTSLEQR